MESVRLDETALQIQLAEQLPQYRALGVIAGRETSLADGHPQCV
jgi:hypothetical protein